MKVLYLIQKNQLRGAEVFASQLANHLTKLGHKVIIVCLFKGDAVLPYNDTVYFLDGNPNRRFRDFRAWKKLAQIIKDFQPDIIQANAGDTLKYAVFSKIIFRWKQAIIFRNASTISLYIKTNYAKFLNSFFMSFVDKIVSVSNTSASDFTVLFPKYKNKVVTIPIGIELTGVNDDKIAFRSMENEQIGLTGPIILHIGGFTFEKNHTGMINIFNHVLKKMPAAKLLLVGDGPLKQHIIQLVSQMGLDNQVVFYGSQKNASKFISNADILILPSIIEGLPGVILEAFYNKTPVVAFDVGGIKEILVNEKTGRLIRKDDDAAFVNGILQALNKSDYNDELIENAYNLVTSQYLNANIATQFLHVYREII